MISSSGGDSQIEEIERESVCVCVCSCVCVCVCLKERENNCTNNNEFVQGYKGTGFL